jgi:hypothetical protein
MTAPAPGAERALSSAVGGALMRAAARGGHLCVLASAGSAWLIPGVDPRVVVVLGGALVFAIAAEFWRARALTRAETSGQGESPLAAPAPGQARVDAAWCLAAAALATAAIGADSVPIAALVPLACLGRAWRWRVWARDRAAANAIQEGEKTCNSI